jgi:hypothetical protein
MDARTLLALLLVLNAVLGLGYRIYRLAKGGPILDVAGQAVLGLLLLGLAWGVASEEAWARWGAFVYALFFAILVMPVWVMGVLIPQRPKAPDYAYTAIYWSALAGILLAALAS